MLERFIRYVKINTRSDLKSTSIPTTKSQWEFLEMLRCELVEYGFQKVELDSEDSYLVALLPSNLEEGSAVPAIGLSPMSTPRILTLKISIHKFTRIITGKMWCSMPRRIW